MRLLRAHFENFRLLRNLEIEFSTKSDRKLTVVRAANETGKTTILHALQWGLYGDDALPAEGDGFRLHPIDWPVAGNPRVPITVTMDFEIIKYNKMAGTLRESRKQYRIVRSAFEELRGKESTRTAPTVRLFALDDSGASPIDAPEALINDELPPELREVFFTDGDRALRFIESSVAVSTKRERVERAIRALLGLSVIEEAMRHVKKVAVDVNRQARALGGDTHLTEVAAQLDTINQDQAKFEAERKDAHQQYTAFDEKLVDIDKKIEEALRKGDREKLGRDLEAAKKTVERLDERIVAAKKEHSQLFRKEALARDLLRPTLATAFAKLKEMKDNGKIPNTTLPVLQERLERNVCICGEILDESPDGARRRAHIEGLIDSSRKVDAVQEIVTDIYYSSRSLEKGEDDEDGGWNALYRDVAKQRVDLDTLREGEGKKLKSLETQVDQLPDTDIQGLRETSRNYRAQRDRFHANQVRAETQIDNLKKERVRLETERDKLLRQQKKGSRIISDLEVAKDIGDVLGAAYERLTNEELKRVSALMNNLFLEMIGADPEQGAIIQRAEVTRDFDIFVFGPGGKTLNPDLDLNGASRRALTLAFILALTKVSGVEAPNVIDTPLGMTSGFVKRAILRAAIRESSQLVLFLTHDEILGCEQILDESAGVIFTLTNPAHYPKMLVNDSKIAERKVLKCGCGHRTHCKVCERRTDGAETETLSVA